MDLVDKVKILEEKVKKLEKAERKRKIIKWIKFSIKMVILITIGIFLYKGYIYFKDNYIEPFDNLRKDYNELVEKIKSYDLLEKFGLKK
jgi:hypothetical protein